MLIYWNISLLHSSFFTGSSCKFAGCCSSTVCPWRCCEGSLANWLSFHNGWVDFVPRCDLCEKTNWFLRRVGWNVGLWNFWAMVRGYTFNIMVYVMGVPIYIISYLLTFRLMSIGFGGSLEVASLGCCWAKRWESLVDQCNPVLQQVAGRVHKFPVNQTQGLWKCKTLCHIYIYNIIWYMHTYLYIYT